MALEAPHSHGEGQTRMRNSEGFMCCLGQFAMRRHIPGLGRKIKVIDILDHGEPFNVATAVGGTYDPSFVNCDQDSEFYNTTLAKDLMEINDCQTTTIQQKVDSIRNLLDHYDHTLVVKNEHLLDDHKKE